MVTYVSTKYVPIWYRRGTALLPKMWIGTRGGGLIRYDRNLDAFIQYAHENNNPKSLSINQIECIFESDQHMLCIDTSNGLNKYNRETDNSTKYYPDEKNHNLK